MLPGATSAHNGKNPINQLAAAPPPPGQSGGPAQGSIWPKSGQKRKDNRATAPVNKP
jgi:hypothetical protein